MAKNRRIPFGYQMINGEITTHPREVYAVSKIFAEYLNSGCGKNYNLTPLMDSVERLIRPLQKKYVWGYSAEYYLSAKT